MRGKFHIFALASEFHISKAVADAATRQAAGVGTPIMGISKQVLEISACITHEMTHFLYFTSHPACIAANFAEHNVYGQKLDILSRHGTTFYADRPKPVYEPGDIKRTDIWADYKFLLRDNSVRDLLLNFGRYPVEQLVLFNEMVRQNPRILNDPGDEFLPLVQLPSDDEIEITKFGPSLEDIVESLAAQEEVAYVERLTPDHGAAALRLAQTLGNTYQYNSRYHAALSFCERALGLSRGSALPIALLKLALCGPCITKQETTWSEYHPTVRLHALLRMAGSLPRSVRAIKFSEAALVDCMEEADVRLSRALGWRSARANINEALSCIGRLITAYQDINHLPALRMRDYLNEIAHNLAFPHRLSQSGLVLQAPVTIFSDGINLSSATPAESELLSSYLRIVVMQFACRYLISDNRTSTIDEMQARRIHRLVRHRFEQSRLDNLDQEFPRDYDVFLDKFIYRESL